MRQVLLVDDDLAVLDGLRKALRARRDWAIDVAQGGAAALERLTHGTFDVVVSDAHMPGFSGEDLMHQLQARWPQTLRVVLSGEVTVGAAERMLALTHQLIAKPVKPLALYERVEAALHARERLTNPNLRDLVGQLGTLPSMPTVFTRLSNLLASPNYDLEQVTTLVQQDPGVCANVLKLVNSAWFGLRTPVPSLRDAVRHLGANPLRSVVLAAGVFSGEGGRHLLGDAMARLAFVKALAQRASGDWLEAASTSAILCDIARLALAERRPQQCAACEKRIANGERRVDADAVCFGASHAAVGAVMLGQWGLPREVVDAVARHHESPTEPGPAAAISLASLVLEQPTDVEAIALAGSLFGLDHGAVMALGAPT